MRAISDILHAAHAATGVEVPCNEEWYHRQFAERDLTVLERRRAEPSAETD